MASHSSPIERKYGWQNIVQVVVVVTFGIIPHSRYPKIAWAAFGYVGQMEEEKAHRVSKTPQSPGKHEIIH